MATNLAPSEILVDTMDAFKKRVPALGMMSTTFTDQRIRKGQTVRGHIRTLPSVGDYGANGYFSNTNDAQALLTDVDITCDQHKHVTLNLDHIKLISDDKRNTEIGDAAYVLGKSIVDAALAQATLGTVTNESIETIANTDFDTLNGVRKTLVSRGANPEALFGLVNSDFAAAINADTRIASRDYFGQEARGSALVDLQGVAGFQRILEYPDLPDNSQFMSGLFFDPRLMRVATALPSDSTDLAAQLGVPQVAATEVVTDEETGLSLLGILHMQPGTLDLCLTVTIIYGTSVGGSATEAAGVRVITEDFTTAAP